VRPGSPSPSGPPERKSNRTSPELLTPTPSRSFLHLLHSITNFYQRPISGLYLVRIPTMAAMLPSTSTLGVEHMETAKLDSDSPSQVEREELEVNLHIEGSGRSLKRRASLSWGEGSAESPSGKRLKDEHAGQEESKDFPANAPTNAMNRRTLIDDLAQELECGCCAALVYNPVTILPCQHSFCGR
jgi:hypothetical protein